MLLWALMTASPSESVELYMTREQAEAAIEEVRRDDAVLARLLFVERVDFNVASKSLN
jgi:hypothetical protein